MSHPEYDVIIVGGRPAGSTLAARLGQQGLRVLVLERAEMPSLPAISSPAIYSSTMRLLDEIGADEADYGRNTPRLRRWVTEVRNDYHVISPVPEQWGRDYALAPDRARFDDALWRHAASFPTVEVRDRFAVTDLLWEDGRVCGVEGRTRRGAVLRISARLVVGADGRFSLVARKAGASARDTCEDFPTTLYYAYWQGAAPYDAHGPSIHVFAPGGKLGFLLMESADDTLAVVTEGQSAVLEPAAGESASDLYLRLARSYPQIGRRIEGAEMVTTVRGIKRVGNLYRTPGGPGWALVGDAFHQKDPLDGQGIFDAVYTARALAGAIGAWYRGECDWPTALADYDRVARAETYSMYRATLERVQREIYGETPPWMWKTLIRWLLEDDEYQRQSGLFLVRAIVPEAFDRDALFKQAIPRGIRRDLRRLFKRSPTPTKNSSARL